jgi:hypothetical protein
MKISYIAIQSKIYPLMKEEFFPPLDFGCSKTVYHGFSETGFYLKSKTYFPVRKHQIV